MSKVLDWWWISVISAFISVVMFIFLLAGGIVYGTTALHCKAYADGKDQDWAVSFPKQCWIVVDGKNYTKQEYTYKFEGILIKN